MRWTVHLDGGPRRVNHAAVHVGDLIYSFGGYCTGDDYRLNESIDVHVLHTQTLRWYVVPQRKDEAGNILKYPEVPFQRYDCMKFDPNIRNSVSNREWQKLSLGMVTQPWRTMAKFIYGADEMMRASATPCSALIRKHLRGPGHQ